MANGSSGVVNDGSTRVNATSRRADGDRTPATRQPPFASRNGSFAKTRICRPPGEGSIRLVQDETPRPGSAVDAPDASEDQRSRAAVLRYPGYGALFLIWTAVGAVTSARHYLGPFAKALELAGFIGCIAYLYPWIALAPLVFRLERRFPLGTGKWVRNTAVLAAFSLPLCLLAAPAMWAAMSVVFLVFGAPIGLPHSVLLLFGFFPIAQAVFWSSVAGGYVIRTRFELREQERKADRLALEKSRLEAGLNQAQLEVLRARLNPHFLFNSLQNISVMAREDPHVASQMLTRLGDLLRTVLRQDSQPETTLREEVDLTRSYVALEQMRFGDRLDVAFEIASGVQETLVPCFLLQPLLENAIVHGLRGAKKTGVITVSAAAEANDLVLIVKDNGIGPPQPRDGEIKVGVGLGSTCERLAKMYADRHTFSMRKPPEGGAEVRITIPLRFASADELTEDDEQPAFADR